MDGAAIRGGITAINTAAGEVDANIALLEIGNPVPSREAVPVNHAPWSGLRIAAEYGDRMTLRVKVAGKDLADLSASARDDDSHQGRERYLVQSDDSAICWITTFRSCKRARI